VIEKSSIRNITVTIGADGSPTVVGHIKQVFVDESGSVVAERPGGGESVVAALPANDPHVAALIAFLIAARDARVPEQEARRQAEAEEAERFRADSDAASARDRKGTLT
jgi:hypothetical protein